MSEKCRRCEKELESMKGLYICLKMIRETPEYKQGETGCVAEDLSQNIERHKNSIKDNMGNRTYEILAECTAERMAETMRKVTYDFVLEKKKEIREIGDECMNRGRLMHTTQAGIQAGMDEYAIEKIDRIKELVESNFNEFIREKQNLRGKLDCPCELYTKAMEEISAIHKE